MADKSQSTYWQELAALHQIKALRRNSPAGWDQAYKDRHQQLESEFSDRVSAAAEPDRERARRAHQDIKDWAKLTSDLLKARWEHLDRRHAWLNEATDYTMNLASRLPPGMYGRDLAREAELGLRSEALPEKPDPKREHADDVRGDVAAAVEEHTDVQSE